MESPEDREAMESLVFSISGIDPTSLSDEELEEEAEHIVMGL